MTQKQKDMLLTVIAHSCECSAVNYAPNDSSKGCIVGALIPDEFQLFVLQYFRECPYILLPHHIRDAIKQRTGLTDTQLELLQHSNDSVPVWPKDTVTDTQLIERRRRRVAVRLESFKVEEETYDDRTRTQTPDRRLAAPVALHVCERVSG